MSKIHIPPRYMHGRIKRRGIARAGAGLPLYDQVEFVSQSAVGCASRTNTVVPAPVGIQDDDLLVLFQYLELEASTPPGGFGEFDVSGSLVFPVHTDTSFWAWRKVAQAESGDYTITHASAFSDAVMLVYRNVDPDIIEDVNPSANSGNNDSNLVANGINIATPGSMLIYAAGMWNVPEDPPLLPSGFNPRWNPHDSPAFPEGVFGLLIGDMAAQAGATGNKTATSGPTLDDWVTTLIALRPKRL